MTTDTPLQALAAKHGFSHNAVEHLYHAIRVGNGSMAQFSHPEFGGSGPMDAWRDDHDRRHVQQCAQSPGRFPLLRPLVCSAAAPRCRRACGAVRLRLRASTLMVARGIWFAVFQRRSERLSIRLFSFERIASSSMTAIPSVCSTPPGIPLEGFSQQQQPGIQGFCFSSQQGTFFVTNLRPVPAGS